MKCVPASMALKKHVTVLGLCGGLCLPVACKPEQACGGLSVGTHVTISILDAVPPGPSDGVVCSFGDLAKGQTLSATVVASVDDQGICYQAIPTYSSLGEWTWTLEQDSTEARGAEGSADMQGYYTASGGGCQGQVHASLYPNGGDVLGPLEAGGPVPWLFSRGYTPSADSDAGGGNCPALCGGSFAVSVQVTR
jgi:hypothetical protein